MQEYDRGLDDDDNDNQRVRYEGGLPLAVSTHTQPGSATLQQQQQAMQGMQGLAGVGAPRVVDGADGFSVEDAAGGAGTVALPPSHLKRQRSQHHDAAADAADAGAPPAKRWGSRHRARAGGGGKGAHGEHAADTPKRGAASLEHHAECHDKVCCSQLLMRTQHGL